MSVWNNLPLVEPVYCPDVFVTGIGKVELVGTECVRIWMCVTTSDGDQPVRQVVAKLIRPISLLTNRTAVMAMVRRLPLDVMN